MWGNGEINWNVASSDRTAFVETKKRSDAVARFCFYWVRECVVLRQAEDLCMYAGCRYVGEFFFLSFFPFAHLWSRPSFEVTLREGRGIKAKQKSRQVHIATRTHKKCNLHNLFFKLFKYEEMMGSLGAWQPIPLDVHLNMLPLHICS